MCLNNSCPDVQVPLCGDSAAAKAAAGELLAVLGYQPRDLGGLARARHLESLPLALFPGWAAPLAISSALWLLLYLLYFARGHLCGEDNRLGWHGRGWENVFSKYINKTCDNHALVLLAACYLPSTLHFLHKSQSFLPIFSPHNIIQRISKEHVVTLMSNLIGEQW